jgi:galactan endo-1,6-beta-galactosidase
MKILPSLALGLALLVATLPAGRSAPSETRVKVNPAVNWGVWQGWGVSLCWWANVFGDRADLADLLFTKNEVEFEGEKLPGLGLNIVRYNAGACSTNEVDGKRMVVSNTILPYRQMEGFWLDGKSADPASPSWNWNADAKQRTMLGMARDRGVDRFELFSNAPMWWMCENLNPSGRKHNKEENLPPKNYPAFATYLATIAAYAKAHWGITFTTVEPFNEPISGWWTENCKQEGIYFSPAAQRKFLPVLRAALDRVGLKDMPIAASDETSFTHALEVWNAYDSATRRLVDQVNVHGYEGGKGPRGELYKAVVKRDRKPLWNSEYGDGHGSGLNMVRNMHLDFADMHPIAWSYWQALDNGGWGLIPTNMVEKTFAPANPKFFALAQYTRHVLPGMTILDSGSRATIAAYDPRTRKLVLVTFNDGPARTAAYDLSRFASTGTEARSWRTEPEGSLRYTPQPPLPVTSRAFTAELAASSIQTFEIDGVVR